MRRILWTLVVACALGLTSIARAATPQSAPCQASSSTFLPVQSFINEACFPTASGPTANKCMMGFDNGEPVFVCAGATPQRITHENLATPTPTNTRTPTATP